MEEQLQKQNPIAYKINDKTINCNKWRKASNPVSYGVYGNKETNFNLCCGENPDSMCPFLRLGLPNFHGGHDATCL